MASGLNGGYSSISGVYQAGDSISVRAPPRTHQALEYQDYRDRIGTSSLPLGQEITGHIEANDELQWYWKAIALASQWMILGGYLILPTTFDKTASGTLRFSDAVLSVIIIALLTGGYSLSALLWFAVSSPTFRQDNIFLPIASISAFAFVATLYTIGTSMRYDLSKATFAVTIGLSAFSTVLYGCLAFFAYRRGKGLSKRGTRLLQDTPAPVEHHWRADNSFDGRQSAISGVDTGYTGGSGTFHNEPSYYANYQANMHPSSIPRSPALQSETNTNSAGRARAMSEEEIVTQNLENLLHKTDNNSIRDSNKSTYRLEWPAGADDGDDDLNPLTGQRRQPTFLPDGSINYPNQKRHKRRPSNGLKDGVSRFGRTVRRASQTGIDAVTGAARGRSASFQAPSGSGQAVSAANADPSISHVRNKSRDDRRKEIEMGNLS